MPPVCEDHQRENCYECSQILIVGLIQRLNASQESEARLRKAGKLLLDAYGEAHALHNLGECEGSLLMSQALSASPSLGSGWVSVNERLPENEAKVLICMKSRDLGYRLAYLCRGTSDFWKGWPSSVEYLADEVTHWLELPSPPLSNLAGEG